MHDKITKETYLQSALNYTGGKYKLLKQILPLFPENIKNFYDVFAGSATVAINSKNWGKTIINDFDSNIISLFEYLRSKPQENLMSQINEIIAHYKLSNTRINGYDYYNSNSADGLGRYNKEYYTILRNDYNNRNFIFDKELIFYILLVYGFNNQVRFNKKGHFNTPVGKRDFNIKMMKKFEQFHHKISEKKIHLSNTDFREVLSNICDKEDFVYLDPPYLISTATYNENGGWTEQDELDLLSLLDLLNNRNIRFALSNVFIHKGRKNELLVKWAEKYNVHYMNFNYNNSNYQSKAKQGETIEVLITNY